MHVGLIGSARFGSHEPFAGGLEAHVSTLSAHLRTRGHRVTILPDGPCEFSPSEAAMRDVSVSSATALGEHHAYLVSLLGVASTDIEVLHNHSVHYLPLAMAPALAVPMVTTLHSPPTPWLESAFAAAGHRTGPVVSVSEANARTWRHSIGSCGVVANGVDLRRFRFGNGGGRYVAWFGRIVPEKGLVSAIAAARGAATTLRFAGQIHDAAHFERDIEPLLGADVVYEGHLDTDGLNELVGAADVALVTPHWDEPYGLVVAESLAMGTPVAAYRRGGIPEIVSARTGRLAPAGDVGRLTAAIHLAGSLDRRACRTRATEHCDVERMVDRYEQLYATALGERPWRR